MKPDVLSLFNRIHFLKDDLFVVIGNTFCSIYHFLLIINLKYFLKNFFLQFRNEQSLLRYLIRINSNEVCRTRNRMSKEF